MTALTTILVIHVAIAAATLLAVVLSRVARRADAVLWHTVWTSVVLAAIAAPAAALLLPAIVVAVPDAAVGRVSLEAQLTGSDTRLLQMAGAAYALGALVLAVRLAAGVMLVRRIVRRSYRPAGHWRARLEHLVGGAAADRCVMHPRVQVPLTIGVRRPVVLLPESWITWDDARVVAVLRHELSHAARRDYGWNVAAALAQAMYWPNPFVWIATGRLRLAAELACDRDASDALGPAAYAGVLVASAREFVSGGRTTRLAPGAGSNLEARIRALLSRTGACAAARPAVRIAVALAFAAAMIIAVLLDVAPAPNGGAPGPGIGRIDHDIAHGAAHRH